MTPTNYTNKLQKYLYLTLWLEVYLDKNYLDWLPKVYKSLL